MKYLFILLISCTALYADAQNAKDTFVTHVKKWQQELNAAYRSSKTSPLAAADRSKFTAHQFYPINKQYAVLATLEKLTVDSVIQMKTSANISRPFIVYGYLQFTLQGKPYKLTLYQDKALLTMEAYKDYLFLPFSDATNGLTTYGGGRYIDMRIPKSGTTILLDFNKAYNPYCAYRQGFLCPKIPENNNLPIAIEAGIKLANNNH